MNGRTEKRGFAARPSDPDGWIKASDASPARATAATAYTARLTIDVTPELRGRIKIAAFDHDSFGRDLPVWQGCRVIAEGEVFLMNPDVGDSLDGRYFGPFPASAVIGHAIPLFTDEDGEGRFVWRAPMR